MGITFYIVSMNPTYCSFGGTWLGTYQIIDFSRYLSFFFHIIGNTGMFRSCFYCISLNRLINFYLVISLFKEIHLKNRLINFYLVIIYTSKFACFIFFWFEHKA